MSVYQTEDIKKVQNHILDILQEIIRVCNLLDIEYFIMGGTALGAVRHQGFIPWDDDLDIGMTRENYEKFVEHAQKHLRKDLFLQTYQTEEDSPFYFAKVRKDDTLFIEDYCKKLSIHSGIYVDIFPYDCIPDEQNQQTKHYKNVKFWLNLYIAKQVTGTSVHYKGMKRILYAVIRTLLHILLLPIPKKRLFHRLDHEMKKYNGTNTEYIGYGGLPKIQLRVKNVLPPDKIEFEQIEVSCPHHVREYLQDNFGEYMKLPPEEERIGHAPYKIKI